MLINPIVSRFAPLALVLSSLLVLSLEDPQPPDDPPEDPPIDACECTADAQAVAGGGPGVISADATAIPLESGRCSTPPCEEKACKFSYSLSVVWEEPVDWFVVVNNQTRASGHGTSAMVTPATAHAACGGGQSATLGTAGDISAAAFMSCSNCGE